MLKMINYVKEYIDFVNVAQEYAFNGTKIPGDMLT